MSVTRYPRQLTRFEGALARAHSENARTRRIQRSVIYRVLAWVPAIAFSYSLLLSPLLSIYQNGSGYSGDELLSVTVADGNIANKIFWTCLCATALLFWYKAPRVKLHISTPLFFVCIYLSLSACSYFWSGFPDITQRRLVLELFIVLSMTVPFLAGVRPTDIIKRVSLTFALIILVSVLAIPVFGVPDFGYNGIYGQKNEMGQIAVVGAVLMWWRFGNIKKNRFYFLGLFFLALVLIFISKSKTSLGLSLVIPGVIAFLMVTRQLPVEFRLFFRSVVGIALAILAFAIIQLPDFRAQISLALFGDPTFTGRTKIWEFCGLHIGEAPIFGHGYGAFWGVGQDTAAIAENAGFISGLLQAHDGYIDVVLETGYCGLAVTIGYLLVLLFDLLNLFSKKDRISGSMIFLFIFVILNNGMESSIYRSDTSLWLVLALITGYASATRRHFVKKITFVDSSLPKKAATQQM